MSIVVNYTKAQYVAKITELEGYYRSLESHLARMEELKSQMFNFWDDENARKTGEILAIEIRQVRNAMTRTSDLLTFFKSTVEKLDGANLNVGNVLSDALGILGGLGI